MPRSRNIKPSLFHNEILGQMDPIVSLLFIGLWCLADREGLLEDRPQRIKAELFPYRQDLDINGYLTDLASGGFLTRIVATNGTKVIRILKFKIHQSPHKTERQSDLASLDGIGHTELTVKRRVINGSLTGTRR